MTDQAFRKMVTATNAAQTESELWPGELFNRQEGFCLSHGDFRESRYLRDSISVSTRVFESYRQDEFNGERCYTKFHAIYQSRPVIVTVDSFSPSFGHASNDGAIIEDLDGNRIA